MRLWRVPVEFVSCGMGEGMRLVPIAMLAML
jgi:hypothetical protein